MVLAVGVATAVLWPVLFVATQCYPWTSQAAMQKPAAPSGVARDESMTFLTLPEWFIVYSAEEYARFIGRERPSRFPYGASVGQYWGYYRSACQVTRGEYAFSGGSHVMLAVIGTSFTIENLLKGLYENTVGRVTEWLASRDTPEDAFAAKTAAEYGTFLHTVPWYDFPFSSKLRALWSETPLWGPHVLRKWERKFSLSGEYGTKAAYGWVIGKATGAAYAPEALKVRARIEDAPDTVFENTRVQRIEQLGPRAYLVDLPRYEGFTLVARDLLSKGVRFTEIAGNDDILVTAIMPAGSDREVPVGRVIAVRPILTEPREARIAVRLPVIHLTELTNWLTRHGVTPEHFYDY